MDNGLSRSQATGRNESRIADLGKTLASDPVAQIKKIFGLESRSLSQFSLEPPHCSLARGAAGIAYALWRTGALTGDGSFLTAAEEWITQAEKHTQEENAFTFQRFGIDRLSAGRSSLSNAEPGFYFAEALVRYASGNLSGASSAVDRFLKAVEHVMPPADVHLGGLGPAIGMSRLQRVVDANHSALLRDRQKTLVDLALRSWGSDIAPGQYLGFAHGAAGLIYAACLAGCYEHVAHLSTRLRARAKPLGRGIYWPVQEGGDVFMGGWCNGPAGHLLTWVKVWDVTRLERDREMAERAAWGTWESRRVLADLCCGAAGQAIAMACFAAAVRSPEWKARAIKLLESTELRWSPSHQPQSLLYGELGLLLAWIECLTDGPEFPVYGGV